MTFTEAAEAILRQVGKPLHYKKITQLAIEQNLLTHVGKTPETTMSTRLATLTKKDKGDTNILRIGPGVFGLRDFTEQQIAAADAETPEASAATPAPAAAPAESEATETEPAPVVAAPAATPVAVTAPAATPPASRADSDEGTDAEQAQSTPEESERAARLEAAAKMFPEEDDDDEPVFGDKEDEGGRRRRRRRRRGGRDRNETETSSESSSAASPDATASTEAAAATVVSSDPASSESAPATEGTESVRTPIPRDEPFPASVAEAAGDFTNREDYRRDNRRDDRRGDENRDNWNRGDGQQSRELRDETGRDAADLLVSLLTRREDRQLVPVRALVDEAMRAGKLSGEPNVLTSALSAAARVDAARRESRGERPRLRIINGRVGLFDWALGPDLVRAEADALVALERLRENARRQLVRKLNELPQPAFTEVLVLLLERLSISSLRTARRPGLPQGEIHLAGVARRASEEIRVAVLIKRGGEIGRERVIELRGSMHHYGPATSAWIITTGSVLSGAREEASQANTTPITLIDGNALGRLLDEHAVGVRHATVTIPYLDFDLFDAIRG